MKLETPPAPPAPAPRGAVGIDIPHPTMENTEERAEGRSSRRARIFASASSALAASTRREASDTTFASSSSRSRSLIGRGESRQSMGHDNRARATSG
eukprot:30666-Pelagococcus_subviridis.AAC.4